MTTPWRTQPNGRRTRRVLDADGEPGDCVAEIRLDADGGVYWTVPLASGIWTPWTRGESVEEAEVAADTVRTVDDQDEDELREAAWQASANEEPNR